MHKLIFSINAGRSGSHYLCRLLNTARNITAFHEPHPAMAGRYLPLFPATDPVLLDKILYRVIYTKKYWKVMTIKRILKMLPPEHIYAETNHMFILSFYDVIMNYFGSSVEVIHLRRYLPRVLKSMIELDLFGSQNSHSPFWTISPNAKSTIIPAIAPDGELDQVDLCIAYLIDIEGRAQSFKGNYPKTSILEVRLEDLNAWEKIEQLFIQVGAEPSEETRSILGRTEYQNRKSLEKAQYAKTISEEYCLERILTYMEKCSQKGIRVPELPHLSEI